ncbi:MAG: DUF72 domain-containing protein, partial [Chloroflexota bacterium]
MTVWIGTSGWQYRHWRGVFYPVGMPQREWFQHYAGWFQTVEVNNTFYSLPDADTFRGWHEQAPADFIYALKLSRYLSHIKRLKDPEQPVDTFISRAGELGPHLGPLLLQLPPNMKANLERLDDTLSLFPEHVRVAVEPRHESWFTEEARSVLTARNAALCIADEGENLTSPRWRTADWGYFRFHGGTGTPGGGYTDATVDHRAGLIAKLWSEDEDVFAFFNNDAHGCALRDACELA